jgi:hypothetical protein
MTDILWPVATQLATLSPILLVYIVGLFLPLVFWRRCPRAALLVFLAAGLGLCVSVSFTFLQVYVAMDPGNVLGPVHHRLLSLLFIVRSLLGAVVIGMLVAAAFVGRAHPVQRTFAADHRATDDGTVAASGATDTRIQR